MDHQQYKHARLGLRATCFVNHENKEKGGTNTSQHIEEEIRIIFGGGQLSLDGRGGTAFKGGPARLSGRGISFGTNDGLWCSKIAGVVVWATEGFAGYTGKAHTGTRI